MRLFIFLVSICLLLFLITACESNTDISTQLVPNSVPVSTSELNTPSVSSGNIPTPTIQISESQPVTSVTNNNNPLPIVEDPMKAPPKNCAASSTSTEGKIGVPPIQLSGFHGSSATLYLDNTRRTKYGWMQKILWPLEVSLNSKVTVHGEETNGSTPLWLQLFNEEPSTSMVLDPQNPLAKPAAGSSENWNGFPSFVYIPKAGCYYLEAKWAGGSWRVTFAAGMNI